MLCLRHPFLLNVFFFSFFPFLCRVDTTTLLIQTTFTLKTKTALSFFGFFFFFFCPHTTATIFYTKCHHGNVAAASGPFFRADDNNERLIYIYAYMEKSGMFGPIVHYENLIKYERRPLTSLCSSNIQELVPSALHSVLRVEFS